MLKYLLTIMSFMVFSSPAFAVLQVKVVSGDLTFTDAKGKVITSSLEANYPIKADGAIRTLIVDPASRGAHVVKRAELYNAAGTVVKSEVQSPNSSTGCTIQPSATAGDAVAGPGSINWNVDLATFATGKCVITLSGNFSDFATLVQTDSIAGAIVNEGRATNYVGGAGVITFTMNFVTVDE